MYHRQEPYDGTLGWVAAIPVVISTTESIFHLFSGGTSLADKIKQRIAWTVQMAQAGSELAAAIVAGGSHESTVNSSERQAWTDVLSAVPPDVATTAAERYPVGYWPVGQPDFYTDTYGPTHTTIIREVNAAAAANGDAPTPQTPTNYGGSSSSPRPSSQAPYGLPPVVTRAAFNWTPYIVAGVAVTLLAVTTRPPSRR